VFLRGMRGFPSGLVNENETLLAGLKREVKEETGLDIHYRGVFYIR